MKVALTVCAAIALTISSVGIASAQSKTTYRDASGRTTGSATTNSSGKTTYRDSSGRTTGSASTNSSGKTTYRDASGRTTGTSTSKR
ncbi:MAG: hypothetical protein NBV66_12720 [Burkholderiaceae bacterium]|jgi:hypothetical protein|nr:hypothetical protein [Burkholderiaceae bacterium]